MFQISERLFYLNSLLQEKDHNCFHQALWHLPLILDNFKHNPKFIIKQSVNIWSMKKKKTLKESSFVQDITPVSYPFGVLVVYFII